MFPASMWPFIKMVNIHIEIGVSVFVVITANYKFIRNSTVIIEDVAVVIESENQTENKQIHNEWETK